MDFKIIFGLIVSCGILLLSPPGYALTVEPALYYSARSSGSEIHAINPEEFAVAFEAQSKEKFDNCMSETSPVSCVLLEINREDAPSYYINGLPISRVWRMRQTNVAVAQDGTSTQAVNENGLNYLEVNLIRKCPDKQQPYSIYATVDAEGRYWDTQVCSLHQEMPDECALAGNPVNFSTGDKVESKTDYIGRAGLSLSRRYTNQAQGWMIERVSRLYNLADPPTLSANESLCHGYHFISQLNLLSSSANNPFGSQITPYAFCLKYSHRNGDPHVLIQMENGTHAEFYRQGDEYRSATPGYRLKQFGEEWALSEKDGDKKYFDKDGFLISSIKPAASSAISYRYVNGMLQSKSNQYGDTISFSYAEDSNVDGATMPGGIEVDYIYEKPGYGSNVSRLQSVKIQGEEIYRYHYSDPRYTLALTRAVGGGNISSTWSYDDKGRVISSEKDSGSERFEFSYSGDLVTVTSPLGKRTEYEFSVINGQKKIVSVEGHASANCAAANKSYDYYPNGTLKSKTDWSGNTTTYERDEFGRETSRTEAYGTPQARTVLTEYHPTLNLPVKITESGLITEMAYDTAGRLLNTKKTATVQ